MIAALLGVRVRAVREVIMVLKKRRQRRREKIKLSVYKNIKVKKIGAVLTMDGTSLQKGEDYIVYKDRSSLEININRCGGHLNSSNAIKVLESLKQRNKLPLVVCTDNGSPFCSQEVRNFLDKNYITQLKNLPR